jgi:Helix-turn-helix domain
MSLNTESHGMTDGRPRTKSPFLNTEAAAEYLGVICKRTLERLRLTGGGPSYIKCGRKVIYKPADLDAWLNGRSFASTAESRAAGII